MSVQTAVRPLTVSDLRSVLAGLPGDRLVEVVVESRLGRHDIISVRDVFDSGVRVVRLVAR